MGNGLTGKVAIVTGGNSGIGAATVRRLAQEGARVGILARREAEGLAVEQVVRDAGGEAAFFGCDVLHRDAIEAAVAGVVSRYGGVNILFNNAGGGLPDPFPEPGGDAAFEKSLRLNLTSGYIMTQVVWQHLVAAGGGTIVNMGSTAAVAAVTPAMRQLVLGVPAPAYFAAKAGMEALTRYFASVGAPHGIRVNAIRPGQIITPFSTRFSPGKHALEGMFEQTQLTPGPGQAEDVANLVYFLASDESRFINAQVIDIDGGAVVKV